MAKSTRSGRIRGSKYDPLRDHLAASGAKRILMTFQQVERILGTTLPKSAFMYPAWWSNFRGTHVEADAWLDAGYKTSDLNLAARTVVFVRD